MPKRQSNWSRAGRFLFTRCRRDGPDGLRPELKRYACGEQVKGTRASRICGRCGVRRQLGCLKVGGGDGFTGIQPPDRRSAVHARERSHHARTPLRLLRRSTRDVLAARGLVRIAGVVPGHHGSVDSQGNGVRHTYLPHGLITRASNGASSRDATKNPREAAIAAIYPSGVGNPRPLARAFTANSA